jgi:hypothetical protein
LKNTSPNIDETRLAGDESEEGYEDQPADGEELILGGLESEEYEDLMA